MSNEVKDERKTIRFTPQQMLEIQRVAHKNKRNVSDMVRLLTVEAILERERKILHDLIDEHGTGHDEVLKQSERVDKILNL
jgi:hypothetical protein